MPIGRWRRHARLLSLLLAFALAALAPVASGAHGHTLSAHASHTDHAACVSNAAPHCALCHFQGVAYALPDPATAAIAPLVSASSLLTARRFNAYGAIPAPTRVPRAPPTRSR